MNLSSKCAPDPPSPPPLSTFVGLVEMSTDSEGEVRDSGGSSEGSMDSKSSVSFDEQVIDSLFSIYLSALQNVKGVGDGEFGIRGFRV